MSFNPNGCSHNIRWEDTCEQCEIVNVKQNLYELSLDCKRVTDDIEKRAGLALSPEVIIDLYHTINRLSLILMRANHE
jgi:hypothetical protein